MDKLKVGIYGATGSVGLEAIESLINHPWFEITHLYASERSAGKKYMEACPLDTSFLPEDVAEMIVEPINMDKISKDIDVAFFALSEDIAKEYELKYAHKFAKHLTVITTSSALRMQEKVPLIITEINADEHLKLAEDYKKEFNSRGAPFPQCNCTTVPFAFALKPLLETVGVEIAFMDSYQSISGSGAKALKKWEEERLSEKGLPKPFQYENVIEEPNVVYEGNVRPIGVKDSKDEEGKVVMEALKILGKYKNGSIIPASFIIDCMCNRVPTFRGHYEHIRVKPVKSCTREEAISIYKDFNKRCKDLYGDLPSSPKEHLIILDRQPQTRFDVTLGDGMSIVIGEVEVKNGWIKLRALSDNLKKGAAKGSIQLMEYLYKIGFI
ncbi:MAG: Asd/ArgC dimerization domain-containing protein [Candidatus Bathyarchaeia archaeon]